jgi:hypothetical protein
MRATCALLALALIAPAIARAEEPDLTDEERAALAEAFSDESEPEPAPLNPVQQALQSMNPDIAVILDAALAAYNTEDNLQTGAHDPATTGFNLQQLELSLGASVDPFFRFDANIVFAQFGVEVEEAYLTTTSLPGGLQARAGQFLTRVGRQNPTHPHSWSFVDQPLVLGRIYGGESNRGLGGELSWLAPLPWYVETVFSATEAGNACCARSFFGGDNPGVKTPADILYTGALKQFFPFDDTWSLLWGLTAQSGPNAAGRFTRTEVYATDLYLRMRPPNDPGRGSLSFTGEVFHRRRQLVGAVLADTGGYLQGVLQFNLRYELGARVEAMSGSANDPLDPGLAGTTSRASLEAAFYPSHFSRLRLQLNGGLAGDPAAPLGIGGRTIFGAVLAVEVVVGAHGAHGF